MDHRDTFSGCHPAVNFLYFALVLVFTMVFLHPVSLVLSMGTALLYLVALKGTGTVKQGMKVLIPMMLMAAILNPAFNHEGVTILTYLPSGNPLTLESILRGLAGAVMLAAVITWFQCYSAVMTSDKFVYLFGRVIPALSLVLSMTLRFIPKFRAQLGVVTQAQRCLGRDVSQGSVAQRVRTGITILSILITWSLENAIETADSMKGRGYGLPGRTAFSIYRFDKRDRALLIWLLTLGGYILVGWLTGNLAWQYAPVIGGAMGLLPLTFQGAYLALCLTPVLLNRKEDQAWNAMQSE